MSRQHIRPIIGPVAEELVRGRRGPAGPSWNDLRVLLALLAQRQPRRCLEIGVHDGHTAALLLEHGPSIEHYVGIDRSHRDPGRWTPPDAGRLAKHDARFRALSPAGGTRGILPAELPCAPFDWIFIDSDHSYKGVAYDTPFAEAVLDPSGGILIWHDYGVPSQFQPRGPIFGVRRYLDERNARAWRQTRVMTFLHPITDSSIAYEIHGFRGSR